MRLTAEEARILTELLVANPVALTCQEAMVPLASIFPPAPKVSSMTDRLRREAVARNNRRSLVELLRRAWSFEVQGGAFYSFVFVNDCTFVNGSEFLRYSLNPGLVRMLEGIKKQHGLDALY
ncbi:hypothetical protein [Ralstonia pseudosolanacearum]|uniref:hypothetical protein n=1 Tax=Ralstonia pseudosolanacearum TaxID=1310165 RepID=UPI003CFB96D8